MEQESLIIEFSRSWGENHLNIRWGHPSKSHPCASERTVSFQCSYLRPFSAPKCGRLMAFEYAREVDCASSEVPKRIDSRTYTSAHLPKSFPFARHCDTTAREPLFHQFAGIAAAQKKTFIVLSERQSGLNHSGTVAAPIYDT